MTAAAVGLQGIEHRLATLRSEYSKAAGQKELLEAKREEVGAALGQVKYNDVLWRDVQGLLFKVNEFARGQLKIRIEETVSAALQAVFERDDIRFEIEMRSVGNQPAASWHVLSMYGDTVVKGDPESSRGGGVSDVVSLALRLALLELSRPRVEGPVLLDEVGKHVSEQYAPNVAQFLKQYAARTGRQIILVTHMAALAEVADVSCQVTQSGGVTEVQGYEVHRNW